MNDVGELKEFAVLHAKAQRIRRYAEVLDRIHTDEDGTPGSWVREWSRAAAEHESRGRLLNACSDSAMARFPFVDGAGRREAQERCVAAFDRWRQAGTRIERLDLELDGGRVRCWASGLSATSPRPLMLVSGGIVSVKEQWAPVLREVPRLMGMAAVVTEMPGVGENTLRYTPESWRMLSGVLDGVAARARVSETYALALSFSGHLALRCAVDDPRIRGVVTTGAPVRDFFTDMAWQRRVPRVTMDTLAHLAGVRPADLGGCLGQWALDEDQLARVDIPVHYVVSGRDEVIPSGEVRMLRQHLRDLHVLEYDDVHGAPGHVGQTRMWSMWSVLRMSGTRPVMRALTGVLCRVLQ